MTQEGRSIDEVKISELAIGTAAFRRVLRKAGYETLGQAFRANDAELDRCLSLDDADMLYSLMDEYNDDSDSFFDKYVIQKGRPNPTTPRARQAVVRKPSGSTQRHAAHLSTRRLRRVESAYSLPDDELGRVLHEYERQVKDSLDGLADRGTDYLAFEAFDDFALELDKLQNAMGDLFKRFGRNPQVLEQLIWRNVPNLYILTIANLARKLFDGDNLWGHLFGELGVGDTNHQAIYKKLFVRCLEKRGMPTYAKDERDFYYLYTALLHGGLSADSWEDLWSKQLLPLARATARYGYGISRSVDGITILEQMRSEHGSRELKKSVMSILEKVPDETMAPLIESALAVAHEVVDKGDGSFVMVNSYGLPPAALEALDAARAGRISNTTHTANGSTAQRHRTIPIKEGSMMLDLNGGKVSIIWKAQQLPEEYVGYVAEYYVDGNREESREVAQSVGAAVLGRVEVKVSPRASYAVAIRLLRPLKTKKGTRYVEVGILNQSFERVHAGCFEFLEIASGAYRLRSKRDQIRQTRRVAFVVKDDREIVPGTSMTLVEEYETSKEWGERSILVYDVQPGASGEVVSKRDGTVLSAWHESYRASIDRGSVIGHTDDGLDLFGVTLDRDGHNLSLPCIRITGMDGLGNYDDLLVTCQCGSKYLDIPIIDLYADANGYGPRVGLEIAPGRVSAFPDFAPECVMELRQRSTGRRVCRYRFAVAPIREFRLSRIRRAGIMATYILRLSRTVRLTHEDETNVVSDRIVHRFDMPLSQGSTSLSMETEEDVSTKLSFTLGLAGIEVSVSERLQELSKMRPLNAMDAIEYPLDGEIVVRTRESRTNRLITLKMGGETLLSGEEIGKGEHRIDIFADASLFAPRNGDFDDGFRLVLRTSFGMEQPVSSLSAGSSVEVTLLRFERALGIGGVWSELSNENRWMLCFQRPAVASMKAEFFVDYHNDWTYRTGRTKYRAGSCAIEMGDTDLTIPQSAVRGLRSNRRVTVKLYPLDDFGEPDEDYAVEFVVIKE